MLDEVFESGLGDDGASVEVNHEARLGGEPVLPRPRRRRSMLGQVEALLVSCPQVGVEHLEVARGARYAADAFPTRTSGNPLDAYKNDGFSVSIYEDINKGAGQLMMMNYYQDITNVYNS